VYRIDISQVVSKYIGETEKNLEKIFTQAEHRNWIIFCDECDALFGKRMSVSNAHDKFANQEVSYLLQRIEDHPALIILASNFKNNIDTAFLRRFNAVISFPLPNEEERLELWKKSVPQNMEVPFCFETIAKKFELSGASILNVIHFAALRSLGKGLVGLQEADVLDGIREEFQKEDRFFAK
jgi:SpoVK/Ycf46/Vps4 family AAA+-type ATPase